MADVPISKLVIPGSNDTLHFRDDSKGQSNGVAELDANGKVPSTQLPPCTDENVTQTATNTNTDYEVLFSGTDDNTTRTEGTRKNSNLKFNPSTGNLKTTKINGVALGDSPKFTDTTYTFTGGTNKFTVTPSGTIISIDVPITPSIENNITGSGTSGSLAKFNGTNTITDGVALGSDTTKYLRNDGTWQVPPDTTYNDATTSTHGLMSTTDKAKVDKIDTTTTSASGNPISITGLKSNQLAVNPVITFEPIQDLHGQSNPYPAGGSKNKLPMTVEGIKAASTSGTWSGNKYTYNNVEYTLLVDNANNIIGIGVKTLSGGASAASALNIHSISTDAQYILNGCPSGGNTNTYALKIYNYTDSGSGVTIPSGISSKTVYIYVNAGVTINTIFYPMLRLATESDATFVPSSNISPISGYDKIEVLSCGKNLFDGGYSESGKYLNQDGTLTNGSSWYVTNYIPVKSGISYTLSHSSSVSNNGICWYDENKTYINGALWGSANTKTIALPSNAKYIRASYYNSWVSTFQIEEGQTASTYQAYHKTTDLSENLPQTVYGGTLDVRSGKLIITHAKKRMNGNDTFGGSNPGTNAQLQINDMKSGIWSDDGKTVCDSLEKSDGIIIGKTTILIGGNNNVVYIYNMSLVDASINSSATLNAYLANHPIEFTYPLGTPIEIQLTPHEISLLKDYAYVSTNGTSISLDYHNGEIATLGDVSQLGETINELGNYISKNESGERTDITSYTSADRFKIPCDGYVVISSETSTSGKIYLVVGGQSTGNIAFLYMHVAGTYQMQSLFVKKGLRCYLSEKTATAGKAWFYPLV